LLLTERGRERACVYEGEREREKERERDHREGSKRERATMEERRENKLTRSAPYLLYSR